MDELKIKLQAQTAFEEQLRSINEENEDLNELNSKKANYDYIEEKYKTKQEQSRTLSQFMINLQESAVATFSFCCCKFYSNKFEVVGGF